MKDAVQMTIFDDVYARVNVRQMAGMGQQYAFGDATGDGSVAPIPAIRRSPLGRQATPKTHLLGSRPNRGNIQADQAAAGTIF
jgi:hypothetical protein